MSMLALAAALSGCAGTGELQVPTIHPTVLPPPVSAPQVAPPPPRELSAKELLSYRTVLRQPGPRGRFFGHEVIGTFRGQRFVAEYICSDMCPDYTVTVRHFIDLKTAADCAAFGAAMSDIVVPYGIGIRKRGFCIPAPAMAQAAG
jgi:hypothetical protein